MKIRRKRGFTLLELLVVLSIIGIVSSALVPSASQWVERNRRQDTLLRMRAAYFAIYGRPELLDHGYLGDMGALPAAGEAFRGNLEDAQPFQAGNREGVRFGWNGAYVLPGFLRADGWGQPLQLKGDDGSIWSAGPDQLFDSADDVYFPQRAAGVPPPLLPSAVPGVAKTNGRLFVLVFGPARDDVPGAVGLVRANPTPEVDVWATQAVGTALTNIRANPHATDGHVYVFEQLGQGFHLVTAKGNDHATSGLEELRGSTRAWVQAGSTRIATVALREAVSDRCPVTCTCCGFGCVGPGACP